jgi:hypothetical protein
MTHALAQVRLARDSGLAEDVVISTFHFDTPGVAKVSTAQADVIASRARNFFTTPGTGAAGAITSFLSSLIALVGHEVRVYDMSDAKPRIPKAVLPFSRAVEPSSDPLPAEVALCLSFRGTLVAGDIRRRHRGRVYIGPFAEAESGTVVAADARPTAQLMNVLLGAGRLLADDSLLTGNAVWCVYSGMDLALRPVTAMHVDDAWDTQRRRGARPTSRVSAVRAAV